MEIRIKDRIYEIVHDSINESIFTEFISRIGRGVGYDCIPRNLTPYFNLRIGGYSWNDMIQQLHDDYIRKVFRPAKKERPIPQLEGEIVVNREDLANELALYELQKLGLKLEKNKEKYNYLFEEYLVLIDRSRIENE